jgi:hypothetical protein
MIIEPNAFRVEVDSFEQLTISTSSIGLTNVRPTATYLRARLLGGPVRMRFDGKGDPTSTTGVQLRDGDVLELDSLTQIRNLRLVRDAIATADASLPCTLFAQLP